MPIPPILETILECIEPSSSFTGALPRVTSSSGATYFVKLGRPSEKEQYEGESESLRLFDRSSPGIAPKLFVNGIDESTERPYMISEYIDVKSSSLSSHGGAEYLAKKLATEVHSLSSENGKFGFSIPTYCGVTRIENGWYDTWEEAYGKMIGGLLDGIEREGRDPRGELVKMGKEVITRAIPHLLGPRLKCTPSFLHGDLWSGNVAISTRTSKPFIYDPSSYFGHNEADLSIARIFEGFPRAFYETYHQYRTKSEPVEEYEQRADLYELFHYLNHMLVFGVSLKGEAQ
ncbi:fructosamine kinase PKL/CAK/FruK [Cantharellus anzutake]|uniref:fructosamine kinase PKL/CAK/FruK n=1 Tax=Cantharellus anzutake TaxID=1750568 RepID=UPI0019062889|nr:fructosamine kinase PKL/CAK/FruK [Cantharellus anzutake]KAF8320615.1 fructosamine kinase PKL/CAK/FruK [Cantharellus anzutake]